MSIQLRQKLPFALLGLLIGIAIALLAVPAMASALPTSVEPVPAAQETEPIFALPGVLQKANNQPFDTFLVTNDNVLYGLVGKTPEIEADITAYRDQGTDTTVKVWGTLYPNGRMSNKPEIIVSNIQSEGPPPTSGSEGSSPGTGTSVAIVRVDVANVRSGPGTAYSVVGQLKMNQVCPITGRNTDNSWWLLDCANGIAGWISDSVVRTVADPDSIPIIAVQPPAVVQPPTPVYTGWKASYFNNQTLSGAPAVVQDVAEINFNWGNGSPNPAVQSDYFSARYERTVNFAAGNYRFSTTYDDGVRVYIDGQIIIDDWNAGSVRTSTADRSLSGNHAITVEYFEDTGLASLVLSWATYQNTTPSPTPNKGDWEASYFTNPDLAGGPTLVQVEARTPYPLDKNWGTGSPAPGVIPNDNWSARFRATYYFDAGDFTFKAKSDDGVRVYLDGHRIIDAWSDGNKEVQNTFNGVGAGDHEIVIEYYERTGNAYVQVYWWREGSNTSNNPYANTEY